MSDSEERDESDITDEEEDDLFETNDHRQRLTAAQIWIKNAIEKREKAGKKNGRITEEQVDTFFRLHSDLTDNKNEDAPTILSAIIDLVLSNVETNIDSTSVRALVQRLVKQCPHFLCIPNDEQQNPLYLAIMKKRKSLVEHMVMGCLENDSRTKYLVEALEDSRANEKRKNCLHLAFEKDYLKPDILQKMVAVASTKTLEAVDTTGRRPMHYAVQYTNCNVDVVRKFIDRDQALIQDQGTSFALAPVNTFLDVSGGVKISVYQEHVSSASAHSEERASKQAIPDHNLRKGGSSTTDKDRGNQIPGPKQEMARAHDFTKNKLEPKPDPKTEHKTARPGPADPAVLRDPRVLSERIGRPQDRDRGKKWDDDDSFDKLESKREQLREAEARARRDALARDSGPRESSKDRRSLSRVDHRDSLRIQTAVTSIHGGHPGSDVAANTPKLLRRAPTMRDETTNVKSESKLRKSTAASKKSREPIDHKAANRNSEIILRLLKLHYMRTRSIEVATTWLYRTNPQDVQTCFEQPKLPSELKASIFEEAFEGTKFDDVLQFVHFPNVKLIRHQGRRAKVQKPTDGAGRDDTTFFFDFLYKKGVRCILRVIVEEGEQTVHSDESIQNSLRRISVEHLVWQKIDLDPEVICGIGSEAEYSMEKKKTGDVRFRNQLRTLDLHWSGTSAVLRAWSEPEGLPSLPYLKTVNIIIPDSVVLYDSTEYIQRKVNEFEERLNNKDVAANRQKENDSFASAVSQHKITVHLDGLNLASVNKASSRTTQYGAIRGRMAQIATEKAINTHEWLTSVDAFATSINRLWTSTRDTYLALSPDSHIPLRPGKPIPEDEVIVALIDDGVSLLDQQFVGRVLEGKTFDYGNGVIGQSYHSARGHGTEMARNILRVCPMAKIYPIRLKVQDSVDGTRSEINLKSAAMVSTIHNPTVDPKISRINISTYLFGFTDGIVRPTKAIYAALEKKATIISMSWTIPIPKDPDPAQKLFEDAIREACKQNVLMFCSSPDGGQFVNIVDYPSAVQRDRIFRIGAAHDYGSASESTDKGVDFILPGVNVNTNSTSPATGSSVATALAAGLAATIIYCFKISLLALKTQTQTISSEDVISRRNAREKELENICKHTEMKKAFASMGTVTPTKFIQVWEVLNTVVDKLEGTQSEEHKNSKVETIMNLCTKLV